MNAQTVVMGDQNVRMYPETVKVMRMAPLQMELVRPQDLRDGLIAESDETYIRRWLRENGCRSFIAVTHLMR